MDSWSEHEAERRMHEARRELVVKVLGALFALVIRVAVIVLVVYAVLKLVGVL